MPFVFTTELPPVLRLLSMPGLCWSSAHIWDEQWAQSTELLAFCGKAGISVAQYTPATPSQLLSIPLPPSLFRILFPLSRPMLLKQPTNYTELLPFTFLFLLIDLPDLSFKSMICFSSIHWYIHLFIQQIFIECQPCVNHLALCYNKMYSLMGQTDIWQIILVLNRQL